MKNVKTVSIQISRPGDEVLETMIAATEREVLPFVSASRSPQQREKEFVSHVRGNRFRIWKVPSSSRSRQNICIPYLRGVVASLEGGSRLTGAFSPHPFHKILVLLPWVILVPILLWASKSPGTMILLSILPIVLLVVETTIVRASMRPLPKEQQDIVQFLLTLFSEKQTRLETD